MTVGTVVGLMAAGRTPAEILEAYPYLEEEDLREALGRAHPGAHIHIAYEASSSGFGLADQLEAHGFTCWVLAPSRLPVSPKSRSEKTDPKDVKRIMDVMRAHFLAGADLPSVWKPSRQLRDDREVVREIVTLP